MNDWDFSLAQAFTPGGWSLKRFFPARFSGLLESGWIAQSGTDRAEAEKTGKPPEGD